MAAAGADGVVRVWDVRTRELVGRRETQGDELAAVAFSPDGALLLSAGVTGKAAVWDAGTWDMVAEWAGARLKEIKERGAAPVPAAVDALNRALRAKAKREGLRLLRAYLTDRLDMLDYPAALANGWDIGSGPTEAECKTLTLRLKRPGARWDRDHAAALMNLKAMYESGQAGLHWPDARKAAA